jgi:hypothetical protein
MGHLHKRQQGVRSTKTITNPKPVQNNTVEDLEPELEGQFSLNKERTQSRQHHANWQSG